MGDAWPLRSFMVCIASAATMGTTSVTTAPSHSLTSDSCGAYSSTETSMYCGAKPAGVIGTGVKPAGTGVIDSGVITSERMLTSD